MRRDLVPVNGTGMMSIISLRQRFRLICSVVAYAGRAYGGLRLDVSRVAAAFEDDIGETRHPA